MATEPAPYVVRGRRRDTADTFTLDLVPVAGGPLEFLPGQFNMLFAFGVGEVPISVSGRSDSGLLHTVRAVGAVTTALCDALEGSAVGVRGPYGRGWDLDAARGLDLLIVAGGLGLAPLRQAVRQALDERSAYGRVVLVVGARSEDLLLFEDELEAWGRRPDVELHVTVDYAGADWRGHVGVVTELLPDAALGYDRTVALLCGPEVMMRLTAVALADAGVPAERIQVSLERNMKCAVAQCGHCQLSPILLCRDGPVLTWDRVQPVLAVREL
jgi:NAD(P)H-flavin reductase